MLRKGLLAFFLAFWTLGASAQEAIIGSGVRGGAGAAAAGPMNTPMFIASGPSASFPSATTINWYHPQMGALSTSSTTESSREVPWPTTGTILNLSVILGTSIAAGSMQIEIVDATAATSISCTISSGTTCNSAASTMAVTAGDLLVIEFNPTATTTQTATPQLAALFRSTNNQEGPILAAQNVNNLSTTQNSYMGFGGAVSTFTTESTASSIMPAAGKLKALYVQLTGAAGASASYTFQLVQNGTATGLTCVITGASQTACNDTTVGHALTIAAGDTISLQSIPSAGTAPTARSIVYSVNWSPTTTNQAVVFLGTNTTNVPAAAGSRFLNVAGGSNNTTTAGPSYSLIPPLSTYTLTMGAWTVAQCPGPGASTPTRSYQAQDTGTNSHGAAVTIASGTTACPSGTTWPGALTGSSTWGGYQPAAGTLIDYNTSTSGTNTGLTSLKIGTVVTVQ